MTLDCPRDTLLRPGQPAAYDSSHTWADKMTSRGSAEEHVVQPAALVPAVIDHHSEPHHQSTTPSSTKARKAQGGLPRKNSSNYFLLEKKASGNVESFLSTVTSQAAPHSKSSRFDFSVTSEQGTRRTMEDQHTILAEGIPFFGVYDGHGGTQCAEYLRDNLHALILGHPEIKTNPEKAIRDGIVEADRVFLARSEVETNESGCVCAVALIIDDVLVVGNVGDSEVVLCRRGEPVVLTVKHNLQSNPSEVERVRAADGKIFHNRVGHPKFNPRLCSLAVTRAVGDAGFKLDKYTDGKPSGVIAEPYACSVKLTEDDEFLIIGCDGLWDVMSYEEVVNFSTELLYKQNASPHDITEELVQETLRRGTTDNVTITFISCCSRKDAVVSAASSSRRGSCSHGTNTSLSHLHAALEELEGD